MILSDKVIIALLLFANLVKYGITFESKGSSSIPHTDNSHPYHTSSNDGYPYVITIDPESEKAVDDKSCHPASSASEPSVPCKTLDYAFRQFGHLSDVKFLLNAPNHTYPLSLTPNFTNANNIGIFGNSSLLPTLPIVECISSHETGTGLTFINSDNIKLESVHFLNCSASQKSTSKDFSDAHQTTPQSSIDMLIVKAGLYFYNCTNVSMYQVSVRNGSQSTGVIMYDVDGRVEVNNCSFVGNRAPPAWLQRSGCKEVYGGGGFSVEFPYCRPGDDKCTDENYNMDEKRRNKNSTYSFVNSVFKDNFACGQNVTDRGSRLLSSNSSHQAVGRGGGLSVFMKGDAVNNHITFINCSFIENHAVWGGGLHIEIEDNAFGNEVEISGCLVQHNHAFFTTQLGTGGGGLTVEVSTHLWPHTQRELSTSFRNGVSKIHIENSNFSTNHGLQGGAASFILCRQSNGCYLEVSISHCSFDDNRAQLGTAVYTKLFPVLTEGYVPQITFENCSFENNSIKYKNETLHTLGMGTIYANQVLIAFKDQVRFISNQGSALSVVGAQVNFTDADALFYKNSGLLGAGIALLGTASILVGASTSMTFVENHASQYGGAIYKEYIIREDLSSDTDCFIHYSEPFRDPQNWTASFKFLNNTADGLGNAIFSSAVLPCSFGTRDPHHILCWNDMYWDYGDSTCKNQIRTKPRSFFRTNRSQILSTPINAYPGLQFQLPLAAFDDLGNNVTKDVVYYAFIKNTSKANVQPGYDHVASNYIGISGPQGQKNITVVMQTENSRIMHVTLDISLNHCPPGFTLNQTNKSANSSTCICPQDLTYGNSIKCFAKELKSFIQVDKWLGALEEDDGQLYMAPLPLYYRLPTSDSYRSLPQNVSQLNKILCGDVNRTGTLCGECIHGYAVAVNSPNYECIPCDGIGQAPKFVGYLFAYIALTYVPIFILFLAIIFLNFKLTSSAAMGFVLYAQMIGSEAFSLTTSALVTNRGYQNVETAYKTIYGIFNLNSLSFLMKPFCLNEHFNTLDVICLDYAIAGFPLIMIALIYFVIRCMSRFHCPRRHRRFNPDISDPSTSVSSQAEQQSPKSTTNNLIHAFSAFLFLSYTKFCLASMKTMSMYVLYDNREYYKERRISLAGQWQFTDHQFLFPYGIIAVFVLIFAVLLPPFLLLGPIQLIDCLIEKPRLQFLRKIWPSIAIHTILDTFQGFYRPGCRFFGGVFVLFRLVVFISYSFKDSIDQHYAIQQIAIIVLICLIALFRPYSDDFHNHVNILIFLNLSILNIFAIFMYADSAKHFSSKIYTLQCILVWLPLLYIISYAIWRRIHNKKSYQKVKSEVKKRFRLRLVSPVSPRSRSEEGAEDENERLNPDGPNNDTLPVDLDEGIFQRATAKNRYRPMKARRQSSDVVTYSEIDPPHSPEYKPKTEEEFSTGDSGAGTGTGRSSGFTDTK